MGTTTKHYGAGLEEIYLDLRSMLDQPEMIQVVEWARPTMDEPARARHDSRQPPGQSGRQQGARGDDDNVKRLLDGMERLLNNNQRSEPQQTVKAASSVALSVLPGISESAAVDFGDWLHTFTNSMGYISANSSMWWQEVVTCMLTFYEDYVKADQFKRLGKWQRVDRRAATMLVAAVSEPIKLELVASRVEYSGHCEQIGSALQAWLNDGTGPAAAPSGGLPATSALDFGGCATASPIKTLLAASS